MPPNPNTTHLRSTAPPWRPRTSNIVLSAERNQEISLAPLLLAPRATRARFNLNEDSRHHSVMSFRPPNALSWVCQPFSGTEIHPETLFSSSTGEQLVAWARYSPVSSFVPYRRGPFQPRPNLPLCRWTGGRNCTEYKRLEGTTCVSGCT
jgi:hypothetical protein